MAFLVDRTAKASRDMTSPARRSGFASEREPPPQRPRVCTRTRAGGCALQFRTGVGVISDKEGGWEYRPGAVSLID